MLKSLEEFWTKQERGAISEKVNWPHIRYSTEFFSSRDACCNDVVDEELWRLGDSIMSMMNHMEG
jgi:hypothetical protein